jgi:hypothetical protein
LRQRIIADGVPLWQVRAGGDMDLLLDDDTGSVVALLDASSAAFVPSERVTYDAYGKPTFETFDNVPKVDSTGNFRAKSDFENTTLFLGMRYDEELGARTNSVTSDLGGFYGGGGGGGGWYFNPNQGRATGRDNFLQAGVDVTTGLRRQPVRVPGRLEIPNFRLAVVYGCDGGGGNDCPPAAAGRGVSGGLGAIVNPGAPASVDRGGFYHGPRQSTARFVRKAQAWILAGAPNNLVVPQGGVCPGGNRLWPLAGY